MVFSSIFYDDFVRSLEAMIKVGAEVVQDVKDVGGRLLVEQIKDTNVNVVGFRHK